MSTVVRRLHCPPEAVFRVIADGWLFPTWIVGASRMREVGDDWPAVGSRLHHSFGVWPLVIDDQTTVLEWDPPHRVVFQPQGWPLGEARVIIDVKPSGEGCLVRMREHAVRGPGALIPKPLLDLGLAPRNRETLHRLAYLAEHGAPQPGTGPRAEPVEGDEAPRHRA